MRLILLALAACLLSVSPQDAAACGLKQAADKDGSVSFSFVICTLAGQSTTLMEQVRKEIRDQGVNAEKITCLAAPLSKDFGDIAEHRVPPYSCKVGDKYLTINGDVLIYDKDGRAGPAPRRARYLVLANPKWSWR